MQYHANVTKKGQQKGAGGRPKGKVKFDPAKHCGAKTRTTENGDPCTKGLGFGTPHPGEGRCRFHGGLSLVIHGRYSKIRANDRLRAVMVELQDEDNPLDLIPDLLLLRARLTVYMEEEQRWSLRLADWHDSYSAGTKAEMDVLRRVLASGDGEALGASLSRLRILMTKDPPKPGKLYDPLHFVKAITAIGAIVDRITTHRERMQVPMSTLIEMQENMALVMVRELHKHLKDRDKGNKIATAVTEAWLDIQITMA